MTRNVKKVISALAALSMAFTAVSVLPVDKEAEKVFAIEGVEPLFEAECEDLTLNGAEATTKVYNDEYPGYTGTGFVWVAGTGNVSFTVDAPETGMYRLETMALMYLGDEGESREAKATVTSGDYTKSYTVKVPATETFENFSFGDIKLYEGENTITFGDGWGYCLYDSVKLTKTPKPDFSKASDTPVDPLATAETKALMKYLHSVYGEHTISGQQEIYGSGHDGDAEVEFDWLLETTGKLPAIRGFDLMNYNPLYGWEDGSTERLIDWVTKKNGIATVCWHINVPIDFDSYELGDVVDWTDCTYKNYQTSNSSFNTANVLKEGTKEREYFDAAMEDLAEQLLLCQEAGAPIIFRPLHEAQGNEGNYPDGTAWFWWGDRGPEVYKELWKLLYTTLTEKYGLHNLIWEFNSYNYSNSPTWYPGDEYVDIIAYDKYNVQYNRDDGKNGGPNLSAISAIYNYLVELTDGGKMVAMSENDTVPSVENMMIENASWLYFCPWYDEYLMSENNQDFEELSKMYNSEFCITLDELPADLYGTGDSQTPPTTEPADPPATKPSEPADKPDFMYGDLNSDGKADLTDLSYLSLYLLGDSKLDENQLEAADVSYDGTVNLADLAHFKQFVSKDNVVLGK